MPTLCKISLVGCGAIGTVLAQALTRGRIPGGRLFSVTDIEPARSRNLRQEIKARPAILALKDAAARGDILVEAAGAGALPSIAEAALARGKDLLCLSVGGLLMHPEIQGKFQRAGLGLHFPSGAVAGLDALKAAAAGGGLKKVSLVTRKPPRGLAGAPYVVKRKIRLEGLAQPLVIFRGNALQAVKNFPENINVAAAVSLAGVGPKQTRVEIVADPALQRNTHTLMAEGLFGKIEARTENVPSPHNPKTSLLAAYSALALLAGLIQGDRRGT